MESLERCSPLFARSGLEFFQTMRIRRSTVQVWGTVAILLLAGTANSGRSDDSLMSLKGPGSAQWNVSNAASGMNAQILASGRRLHVNIDGFNSQRELEIAKDSRKLLSLAIALKAGLDRNPGKDCSPAAERK